MTWEILMLHQDHPPFTQNVPRLSEHAPKTPHEMRKLDPKPFRMSPEYFHDGSKNDLKILRT